MRGSGERPSPPPGLIEGGVVAIARRLDPAVVTAVADGLLGGGVRAFEVTLNDQTWQSADGNVRMSYIAMQNNNEDSNGILTIEVKGALLEPGKPARFEVVGGAKGSQRWFGVYLVGN